MKRGLSLLTSLMMSASVIGGAASQAISPVAIVSAAAAQPVIAIGDSAYNGTTLVSSGAKSVSIPLSVTSTDLLAMVVNLEVTADKAGAKDPTITGIKEVVKDIMPNDAASNVRSFTWTHTGLKAPTFEDKVIANIEIEFPDDVKDDSTYTLKVKKVDASDKEEGADYKIDENGSDLVEKIAFGDNVSEDYTLNFAEGKGESWTNTDKITVEAGQTVTVGLNIKSAEALGAIVFNYDLTKDAAITGYKAGKYGEVDASEVNINKAVWTIPGKIKGQSFAEETLLYTIDVKIPDDAKNGSVYTLSIVDEDTSTPEEIAISPVKLPAVDLVVGEAEEETIELSIAEVTVPYGTTEAKVPVVAKNGNATAIVAMFEALEGAEVVGIEAADVAGDLMVNEKGNYAAWTNESKGSVKNHEFGADGEQLFILTVKLPEGSSVTRFPVQFTEGKLDISNEAEVGVTPVLTNGAVIIEAPAETTPAETTPAPVETTPAPAETLPAISIDLDDPIVSSFDADIDGLFENADYEPEFYYEHEPEFDRKNELKASVKLEVPAPTEEDKEAKAGVVINLTDDNFILPDKEEFNPGKVYNGEQFYYTVPVKLNGESVDVSAISVAEGPRSDEVLAAVQSFLKTVDATAKMPVMIGQLGDIDLSHKTEQIDANAVLKLILHLDSGKDAGEVVNDVVLADATVAKAELAEHEKVDIVKFALFLGNADLGDKSDRYEIGVSQVDANTILKAILQRDAIDPTNSRIPYEAWEKAGTAFPVK